MNIPQETNNTADVITGKGKSNDANIDYATILKKCKIPYKQVGYHYQVGEITQVQGWILHVSVVRWQIVELLETVITILLNSKVPFKIIHNKEAARTLLDGGLGPYYVGKVLSIYPDTDDVALSIAKELIAHTAPFKGPRIPTDHYLGGSVYTRYGSFNPVIRQDEDGKEQKYIYTPAGELAPDIYTIPFSMPVGVKWPFGTITPQINERPIKTLKGIYKPIYILKSDPKGNVFKAVYLRKLFLVNNCVIKQGKQQMWSDEADRNISDRLLWQQELYEEVSKVIRLPKIIECFSENGDTYLAMEYIHGDSLLERIYKYNKNCSSWDGLLLSNKMIVLDYLLQVVNIIQLFHNHGIVHRDITPVNFLVTKENKLVVIDIELAYSIKKQKPVPAFEGGTHGFMGPEQLTTSIPTLEDDIYALGAFMITILTGLSPLEFNTNNSELLTQSINFNIGSKKISTLIANCVNIDPIKRPSLQTIILDLQQYKDDISVKTIRKEEPSWRNEVDNTALKDTIQGAINGLSVPPMPILNGLWRSRISNGPIIPGKEVIEFSKSGGLYEGVTGTLYLLSRAYQVGFTIDSCSKHFYTGWNYLKDHYLSLLPQIEPGLYGGAAGIALAMAYGMRAGLIANEEENRLILYKCLTISSSALDISSGTAGQAAALLQCMEYMKEDQWKGLLAVYLSPILKLQQKGCWVTVKGEGQKKTYAFSFSYGNTGIVWLLLEAFRITKDEKMLSPIHIALDALQKRRRDLNRKLSKEGFRKTIEGNPALFDGIQGVVLVYIKAFEVLKNPAYQKMAEEILYTYPKTIVHDNFMQITGLSGLLELYMEAYLIFRNPEWQNRARWITQFLMHTCHRGSNGTYHWLGNNYRFPTADLMVGNSGIIHSLIRSLDPAKLGYRLLH